MNTESFVIHTGMTFRQICFTSGIGIFFLFLVIELMRRQMMRIKYSLLWVFISFSFITFPLFQKPFEYLSLLFGIKDIRTLYFMISILGLFLLSLQFSIALSVAYSQRKKSISEIALIENRISQLERMLKEKREQENDIEESSARN